MNEEASAAWDRHAPLYTARFAPLTGYIARSMFAMVAPRLPPRARVLDIACGPGALALSAVEHMLRERSAAGDSGLVVATDFSPAMVERTRQAAAALGAGELIHCEVQNGEALTLPDESFDAVFSSFGIFLFHDRKAGWREAARVLKPGGVFATAVWQGPATNAMLRAQMTPLMAALPPRLIPAGPSGWIEVSEAEKLVAEVSAAGPFAEVRCYPFQATLAVESSEAVWEGMLDNPVMGALLRRCEPSELDAVRASILQSFSTTAGGPALPVLLDSTCNILLATRSRSR